MIKQAGIWQNEGSFVFKLKETGAMKKNPETGEYEPEFVNEAYFRVGVMLSDDSTPATQTHKEIFLAEEIVKKLNAE